MSVKKAENLHLISGDLLKCDIQYIVHQCNCVSSNAAHLAEAVFKQFPWSDIYSHRKDYDLDELPLPEELPSNIIIRGDGQSQRYVINLLGQYYPGHVKYPDSKKDGYRARQEYFMQALNKISKIEELEEIAFPYKIGCGAAGGDWQIYLKMINYFASLIDSKVYIIKLED